MSESERLPVDPLPCATGDHAGCPSRDEDGNPCPCKCGHPGERPPVDPLREAAHACCGHCGPGPDDHAAHRSASPAASPTYDPPIAWAVPYGGSDPRAKGSASPAAPRPEGLDADTRAAARAAHLLLNMVRCPDCHVAWPEGYTHPDCPAASDTGDTES